MKQGVVPVGFGIGVTVPIPKEQPCKVNASFENFRGITINPTTSKIFEHVILEMFGDKLKTDDRQFGFKKA